MTPEQTLNKTQPAGLAEAETLVRTCWRRVADHCESGRCSCHLDVHGSANVINGCAAGRMLVEEYRHALGAVRDLLQMRLPLEAGDMGSTLEPQWDDVAGGYDPISDAVDHAAETPFT